MIQQSLCWIQIYLPEMKLTEPAPIQHPFQNFTCFLEQKRFIITILSSEWKITFYQFVKICFTCRLKPFFFAHCKEVYRILRSLGGQYQDPPRRRLGQPKMATGKTQFTQSQSDSLLIGNSVWTMSCQGKLKVAWLFRHHKVITMHTRCVTAIKDR